MNEDQNSATDHELVIRRDAAQKLLDNWKDKKFRMGDRDCVRLTAEHLREMGYQVKIPPIYSYKTLLGATKKLKELGFETLAAAVDDLGLERIAPAFALVGDLIELAGENDKGEEATISALTVAMGNGRVLGFHEVGCVVMQPLEYKAAWRVVPK
jgi:hypothetical protein